MDLLCADRAKAIKHFRRNEKHFLSLFTFASRSLNIFTMKTDKVKINFNNLKIVNTNIAYLIVVLYHHEINIQREEMYDNFAGTELCSFLKHRQQL